MSNKTNIEVYPVNYTMNVEVPSTENGVIDKEYLEKAKRSFLAHCVGVWADDIIATKRAYPTKGKSTVTFSINSVLMGKDNYERLINDSEY